jgi:hypothetical protein
MKRKPTPPKPKPFRLTGKAAAMLGNYLAQIREGITNVCRLHTRDAAPSLKQTAFEELYIDKILAQTVTSVSMSIRSMADGLAAQKEAEARALKGTGDNQVIAPQGDENKKENA